MGEHPLRARCSPSRSPGFARISVAANARALCDCSRQLQPALRIVEHVGAGGGLCRPTRATPSARRSIAVPWRERPPFWTAWPAKPAASEVVAHATLSLPQPERPVVAHTSGSGVQANCIRVVHDGRRLEIVRLATRALKALRVAFVSLRPRCARLSALTARAATRFPGNYRRPLRKCLTTVGSGATVGSTSPAAVHSPLHIARCGARSNRRSQATVRSPLLKPLPGCLFVRRHVRETDDRTGLRFGPRPGADPTVHHRSRSSRCHGGTPVRSRCVGRCAQRAHSP